ncbi:MAG: FkbM family methyltransferase [Parvularculaceae bacterium]
MQPLLAKMGTMAARWITKSDVELIYDGIWVRRIGDCYFGDKTAFDYYLDEFRVWNKQHVIWLKDPEDFWFYDYESKPGDIIVDVGAGFGNDALIFSRRVGPDGKVISIEAHPIAANQLRKTCKWSKLDNVTPLGIALGEREGTLRIGREYAVESFVFNDDQDNEAFEVPVRRFDDVAKEVGIDRVDLLKMNIEGAEIAALRGMPETLAIANAVVVACHDFRSERGEGEFFRTKEEVRNILNGAGFELCERLEDPRPYVRDTLYGRRAKPAG